MQIKSLNVANVRLFEQAEFNFHPGMNLLVGINGAGKSTVMDVLRYMLSQSLPKFTAANRRQSKSFDKQNDISIGSEYLNVEMRVKVEDILLNHLINLPRDKYIVNETQKGQVRNRTTNLEAQDKFEQIDETGLQVKGNSLQNLKKNGNQPVAVFFSAHRSVVGPKLSSAGDQAAAYADALEDRALQLDVFAEWWNTREALATENEKDKRLILILNEIVRIFLDGYSNLHVKKTPRLSLWVNKRGTDLNISQLSDGERSILALIFDLTRRLALANPKLDNPQLDGKAVVLIDELDLHLHPGWQRTIVKRLTETFPSCQFIATTHSPLIIGEVKPENIILIDNGKATLCGQSLGMDTNWILKHIMGTPERNETTFHNLEKIETLIENEEYDKANEQIKHLRSTLGDFPELVGLQAQIDVIEFLSNEIEDEEYEEDEDE